MSQYKTKLGHFSSDDSRSVLLKIILHTHAHKRRERNATLVAWFALLLIDASLKQTPVCLASDGPQSSSYFLPTRVQVKATQTTVGVTAVVVTPSAL